MHPSNSVEIEFRLRKKGGRFTPRTSAASVGGGKTPRLTQVLALAIQLDDMIRRGEAASFADLARLGCLTCERISQIMKLLWLAPDIQREILSLPNTHRRFPVGEVAARRIAETPLWEEQREAWCKLKEMNQLA